MIFRKPYAFLIKNFRLINLLLTVLTGYLAYKTYHIINFFNDYITNNYSGNFYEGFYINYISSTVILLIILTIIGIASILLLFIYKKKPLKAYLTSIVYYIVLLVFFVYIKNVMISLESSVITAEAARIHRDLSILSIMPQAIFIILFFIRSLGLNISKFNFKEDLKDLEISEQDSEEVELTIKSDGTKLKRNIRRFIREFKYYIKENKFIFIVICIILLIGVGYLIYKALPVITDRNYNQGDTISSSGLSYNLKDSILTNMDYRGNSFGKDVYYVVVRLSVTNTTDEDYTLDYKKFRLELKDRLVYPTQDLGGKFIDYAVNYASNLIRKNSTTEFSLIFPITSKDIKKNYNIKIENGYAINKGISVGKYNYVNINPIIIDTLGAEKNFNVGDEISFVSSNLGKTTLKINNPLITDKYIYEYEYCHLEGCENYKNQVSINYLQNTTTLLVFDYEYNLDSDVPFASYTTNPAKFIETFGSIKYLYESKIVTGEVKNVTPNNLKNQIVLEVTNKIESSKEIYLSLLIRNKEYLIRIN